MNIQSEISRILKHIKPQQYSRVLSSKANKTILAELIVETSFLKNVNKLSERIYCIWNNIIEERKCYNCKTKNVKFK